MVSPGHLAWCALVRYTDYSVYVKHCWVSFLSPHWEFSNWAPPPTPTPSHARFKTAWCSSAPSFKGDLDRNECAADGKWAGHHTGGGVAVTGVMEWERAGGSREEKGVSRETGMMSLWVILLTGNHAAPVVVIGFPREQERPGTSPGVFIEFYPKGQQQQLACGLRIERSFICRGREVCVCVCVFACICLCKLLQQRPAN